MTAVPGWPQVRRRRRFHPGTADRLDEMRREAEDPQTPPWRLRDLFATTTKRLTSDGPEYAHPLRSACLRNPNYPASFIRAMALQGDPDAMVNPALDLILVTDPVPPDLWDHALFRLACLLVDPSEKSLNLDVFWTALPSVTLRCTLDNLAGCNHAAYRRWGDAMNALAERLP